eukprot:1186809-Prorocentrum_minimum.AAC.6
MPVCLSTCAQRSLKVGPPYDPFMTPFVAYPVTGKGGGGARGGGGKGSGGGGGETCEGGREEKEGAREEAHPEGARPPQKLIRKEHVHRRCEGAIVEGVVKGDLLVDECLDVTTGEGPGVRCGRPHVEREGLVDTTGEPTDAMRGAGDSEGGADGRYRRWLWRRTAVAELREKCKGAVELPSEGAVDDIAGAYTDLEPLTDLCDKLTAEGATLAFAAGLLVKAAATAGAPLDPLRTLLTPRPASARALVPDPRQRIYR